MATTPTPPQVYRTLLRQFTASSIQPRPKRNVSLQAYLRQLVQELPSPSASSESYSSKAHELLEVGAFLKSQRLHKDLLERYNPTHGMSVQERTQATARRVGLDVPDELDMNK